MANETLMASIDKKSINVFRKDFTAVLRLTRELDRYYDESQPDFDLYFKKFKKLIDSFNKKYRNLKLKLEKNVSSVEVHIYLNERKVKEVFVKAASNIPGLQSLGTSDFGTAMVSGSRAFTEQLDKIKNRIYITYYDQERGLNSVFLRYDSKAKKVQLVYDEDSESESSAEFQIAAYYALNKPYNKKINLHDEAATLGFSLWPDHLVRRKYEDKFNPHITE